MKRRVGFAMAAFTLLAQAPAFGAGGMDCATLIQNVDAAAASIARNSVAYWAERQNFIGLQGAASQSPTGASAQLAQSKARALPLKTAMPDALLTFATLVTNAQSANCISEEKASALKEKTFTLARGVNFDKFPLDPAIEGTPASQTRPKMPTK